MINFVTKDESGKEQWLKIRHKVVAVTTGILVVYLVGVAGVLGWWWYSYSREKRTSTEIDGYLSTIADYSAAERLSRRLGSRVEDVAKFLKERGSASDAANVLTQVLSNGTEVIDWKYHVSGGHQVTVKTTGPERLLEFSEYMQGKYTRVQPDEVGWKVTEGWYGRFLYSGRKEEAV